MKSMNTPSDVGLVFLIVTNQWWGKGPDLAKLKRKASRKGVFVKGEKRTFDTYLVHQDTEIDEEGNLVFPNDLALDTALKLGVL